MDMDQRAYTYVDRGTALVANGWVERRWSAFMGNTTDLVQKSGDFEWLASRCAEFEVVVDGDPLGIMEFGEVAWAEENDSEGATLVEVKWKVDLEFTLRTMAYHDNPAMVRSASIRNAGRVFVTVEQVTMETLPLHHPGSRVLTHGFEREEDTTFEQETGEQAAAAVAVGERGLILGVGRGGVSQFFTPREDVCVLMARGPHQLAPGASWRLPPTFLLPYTGPLDDALQTVYADLLRRLGAREEADQESDPET